MSLSTLVVVLGNLLFVLVCGTIGVRLTLKARRTRQAPELLMGLGLVMLVAGLTTLAASGVGRVTVGELKRIALMGGLGMFAISIALQSAFVMRTFRPGRSWARLLTVFLSLFGLVVMTRIGIAAWTSPADMMSAEAVRASILWLRIPFAAVYAWTAVEGLQQYRMAQRREKIDIGDPILTNRFFLWSMVGLLACANSIVSTILHAFHMTAFNHPVGAATLGIGASLASVALLLVFMPPGRYIEWLRARNGLALI